MRIRGVSEDGEDLSALLPSMEKKFNSIGLTLKKNDNTFKSTYEIFSDLAKVWRTLSDFNRADILELVAGKLQGNVVASMLNNWQDAEGALQAGLNSFGSAARENEKYMESMQGHVAVFKNTVSEFWSDSLDSSTLKSLIDVGTKFVSTLGNMNNAVVLATGIFLTFKSKAVASTITSLYSTVTALFTTKTALQTTAGAAETATVAMTGLQRALGVIGLIATGASILYTVFNSMGSSIERSGKLIEETNNKYSKFSEELDNVTSYYKENHEAIATDTNVKDQLFQMQNQLIDTFGEEARGIDLVNGKYEDQMAKIDELKKKKLDAQINDTKFLVDALKEERYATPSLQGALRNGSNDGGYKIIDNPVFKDKNMDLEQYYKSLTDLQEQIYKRNTKIFTSQALIPKNAKEWLDALTIVQDKIKEIQPQYDKLNTLNGLYNQKVINTFKTESASVKNFSEEQTKLFDNLTSIFSSQPTKDFQNSMVDIQNTVRNFDGSNMTTVIDKIKEISSIKGNQEIIDSLNNIAEKASSASNSISDLVQGSSTDFDKLAESITSSKEEIELLTDAQDELSKNNTLSTSTVAKLNKMYGDFVKVTGLSKDKVLEFLKAKKQEKFEFIDSEIEKTETAIKTSKLRISALEEEYNALKKISEERANQRIDELNQMVASGQISDREAERQIAGIRRLGDQTNISLQSEMDNLTDLETKLNVLKGARSDLSATAAQADKQQQKSNDTYSETNEILTATLKNLQKLKNATDEVQRSRAKLKKGTDEYGKSLEKENVLLQKQIDLIDKGLKNPTELVTKKVTTTTKTPSDSTSSSTSTSSVSSNSNINNLISNALGLQGKFTYKQITGDFKGTYDQFVKRALSDCSQFVQEMFQQFTDVNLPRTAAAQFKTGTKVDKADLQPGDLVFFNTTGKTASHVGIYTGNGKFIQMGNHGLSEQSLNSKTWTQTYKYDGARRVVSGDSTPVTTSSNTKTSSASGTKTTTKNASQSDIDSAIEKYTDQKEQLQDQIYQNRINFIENIVTKSEDRLARFDSLIAESQAKQSKVSDSSAEYRKEESNQSYYYQQQIDELRNQNTELDKQVKAKQITSGEFDKQKIENDKKILDLETQIQEKRDNIVTSQLKTYDKQIEDVRDSLSEVDAKMGLLTEGSKEYNDLLASQLPLLRQEEDLHKSRIKYIQQQLQNEKLSAVLKEELTKSLKEETSALYENEAAIKSNTEKLAEMRESAADKIIDDYKAMIEKQRDLELDAFDQRKEAEDKRHEQVKKNLEEENKLFEDVINAQLKALDRQNVSDDYDTELNKKLKDRQDLQNKINELSLDDSIEGKAKKKDLQEQLDTKDEEIAKFKLDRERELRKQNLQDQLDDHKKQNDQIAESEDKLNQEINDNIDQEKKAVEQKYIDILENDKFYYDLKQGLLSEDSNVVKATLAELQTGYDTYFGTLKGHVFDTDQEFKNLNFTLEKSLEMLQKYSNGDYSGQNDFPSGYTPPSDINSDTGTGGSKVTPDAQMAWSNYLSNKLQAETLRNKMATLDKKSQQYKDAENTFNNLSRANANYRSTYKFKDGSYDQLKSLTGAEIFSAETGGMTPSWGKGGKFLLAHEKELVLNKSDTSNLITAVDITRNIVSGLKNLTQLIKPQPSTPALAGYGDVYLDINIERLTGDEKGARTLFSTIQKNLKKAGK